jgi:DNA-binding Lrp family transcriptional regulator
MDAQYRPAPPADLAQWIGTTTSRIPMTVWAYVFVTSRYPKRLLPEVRGTRGVLHADALFGSPDIVAIVAGDDVKTMDEVIDRIAELPDVVATESKVARVLDGVGPPRPHAQAAS